MRRLSKFWKRITRPEEERRPDIVARQKRYLDLNRERDKAGLWGYEFSSIGEIEKKLKYPIRQELKKRVNTSLHPVSVLDLGSYAGTALGQLKNEFNKGVRTVGVSLEKIQTHRNKEVDVNNAYFGVDKMYFGDFKKLRFKETFDLIYSHKGVTFHSFTPLAEIEKVLSLLRPKGVAILDLKVMDSEIDEVTTLLHQHGLRENKDYHWDNKRDLMIIHKPKIKLPV